ncbi:MAG: cardiolipin synthase, partial [Burkholderia sp.]|nr:cardiolipin synthase [Burkholderia sp.]
DGITIRLEDYANIPWYRRAWHGGAYLFYKSVFWIITMGGRTD